MQRIGGKTISARELGDRKEAPVREVETVNEKPFRHAPSTMGGGSIVTHKL
jgi:hypothetical protein